MDIRTHRRTGQDSPEEWVFPSTQETHDIYFFLRVVFHSAWLSLKVYTNSQRPIFIVKQGRSDISYSTIT